LGVVALEGDAVGGVVDVVGCYGWMMTIRSHSNQ
jgi:hypothetical protein